MNTDNLKKEMGKVRVGHVALLCAVVFVAFAIIGGVLIGVGGWDGMTHPGCSGWNIGPGQLYDINDHADLDLTGVTKIEVNSVSDKITLQAGDASSAALVGQCRTTGDPVRLETRRDGDTLKIWVEYPTNIGFTSNNTQLTITLAGYGGDLSVGTTSGAISARGLPWKLGDVSLSTVSGRVEFSCDGYARLEASSTSGSLTLDGLTGPVSAGTVSGSVTLTGLSAPVTVNTTSGSVDLAYTAFADTNVSTVSGGVQAALPADAAFTVAFDSVSGGFASTHPALSVSSADGGFSSTANGGGAMLRVDTTSGGLRVNAK